MLLGVADRWTGDWTELPPAVVAEVAALGYRVMNVRVRDPFRVPADAVARTRDLYAAHGLVVGQTVGDYGGGLVHPDGAVRDAAIGFLARMCDLTARLGARDTYLRPGSLHPDGAWLPHPGNRSPEVFDRLVGSVRRAAGAAEAAGVRLALEAGVVSPVWSAARARDLIDAVGSPAVGFNLDPVNLVGSLPDAWDTTRLIADCIARLGDVTIGAHAKDVRIVPGLLPAFAEAEIGDGVLDHVALLRGLAAVAPHAHVLVEHLPPDRFAQAKTRMDAYAAAAGVAWGA